MSSWQAYLSTFPATLALLDPIEARMAPIEADAQKRLMRARLLHSVVTSKAAAKVYNYQYIFFFLCRALPVIWALLVAPRLRPTRRLPRFIFCVYFLYFFFY